MENAADNIAVRDGRPPQHPNGALCMILNMGADIRITATVALVLRAFLDDVSAPQYGIPLMKATGLQSGTVYPTLARLEAAGWLVSAREDIDPVSEGRPPRRYYRLNPAMAERARLEVATLSERLHVPAASRRRRRPGLAGA
jgi:PadR family transcriptional regulator, regulatory protein PadR